MEQNLISPTSVASAWKTSKEPLGPEQVLYLGDVHNFTRFGLPGSSPRAFYETKGLRIQTRGPKLSVKVQYGGPQLTQNNVPTLESQPVNPAQLVKATKTNNGKKCRAKFQGKEPRYHQLGVCVWVDKERKCVRRTHPQHSSPETNPLPRTRPNRLVNEPNRVTLLTLSLVVGHVCPRCVPPRCGWPAGVLN